MSPRTRLACWSAITLGLALIVASSVDLAVVKANPNAAGPERIALTGSPADMGATLAQQYGEKIETFHPHFLLVARQMTGRTKAELYAVARSLARSIHADDIAEMKAIADGCALGYDDVLFLNCFYSLTGGAACRQLVVWGDRSKDGKLMHARNLDWRDYGGRILQRNHLVADYAPAAGGQHRYLLMTWPGLTAGITGANEHGVTIAYNQLGPTRNGATRVTEPTFFTIKRALRTCKTLAEAVDLIRDAKPRDNGSIMISDANAKTAVVVELIDGKVGVRDAGNRPMIGNANHATRDSGVQGARRYGDPDAPTCTVASAIGGPLDPADMQGVMRHRRVLASINLLSVVFVPADNRMYIAAAKAPAASGDFHTFEMFTDAPAPGKQSDKSK